VSVSSVFWTTFWPTHFINHRFHTLGFPSWSAGTKSFELLAERIHFKIRTLERQVSNPISCHTGNANEEAYLHASRSTQEQSPVPVALLVRILTMASATLTCHKPHKPTKSSGESQLLSVKVQCSWNPGEDQCQMQGEQQDLYIIREHSKWYGYGGRVNLPP
jgi:hypothetical protein